MKGSNVKQNDAQYKACCNYRFIVFRHKDGSVVLQQSKPLVAIVTGFGHMHRPGTIFTDQFKFVL